MSFTMNTQQIFHKNIFEKNNNTSIKGSNGFFKILYSTDARWNHRI